MILKVQVIKQDLVLLFLNLKTRETFLKKTKIYLPLKMVKR